MSIGLPMVFPVSRPVPNRLSACRGSFSPLCEKGSPPPAELSFCSRRGFSFIRVALTRRSCPVRVRVPSRRDNSRFRVGTTWAPYTESECPDPMSCRAFRSRPTFESRPTSTARPARESVRTGLSPRHFSGTDIQSRPIPRWEGRGQCACIGVPIEKIDPHPAGDEISVRAGIVFSAAESCPACNPPHDRACMQAE
jgi:hypothetical protein